MRRPAAALVVILVALALLACDDNDAGPTPGNTSTDPPATVAPTDEPAPGPSPTVQIPNAQPAADIELPSGFAAYVIAEGLSMPTSIAVAHDGTTYVSERNGDIFRLQDAEADGVFEENVLYGFGFVETTGIAVSPDGELYISSTGQIAVLHDEDADGDSDATEEVITGLPNGRHQNNGMAFGPDGKLYITNGSTCDDCAETDERSAAILQANPDGSELRVYASGLRNPYDIVFDAQGRLWSTDNGSDAPCGTIDELNLIEDGGDYGWPYGEACDPYQSGTAPAASLGLHTASTGLGTYNAGQFPREYRGDLFATLWGSLVYDPELTPQLLHIDLDGDEATVGEFGTGFQNPIDVVVDADGTLLVLDFGAGRLYRIVYQEA